MYFDDVTVTADTVSIIDVQVDRSGGGAYIDDAEVSFTSLTIQDSIGNDTWGVGIYIRDRSNVSVSTGIPGGRRRSPNATGSWFGECSATAACSLRRVGHSGAQGPRDAVAHLKSRWGVIQPRSAGGR